MMNSQMMLKQKIHQILVLIKTVYENISHTNDMIKPLKQMDEIKPKINKEHIVNFKLKKAIEWISKNVQKDAEAYI